MLRLIQRIWTALKRMPWSAHLLRANDRYNNRLGNQLAGGITYFSVLTIIPALMFVFSMFGMTLTVIRQDWLESLKDLAVTKVGSAAGGQQAVTLIDKALQNWRSVLLVALVSAAYAGSGWMGNLRGAVRAQWRPDFDWSPPGRNFIAERFVNLFYFLLLVLMVTLTFALSTLGGQLGSQLVSWLGLDENPGAQGFLQLSAFLLTVLLSFGMFWFLYEVLPQYEAPRQAMVKGSLMAALMLAGLQYLTTWLIAQFSTSFAAIVFGNIIIVMLFFNLFARLTLFAAAWIATAYQPAFPRKYNETDAPLRGKPGVVTVPGHWAAADLDYARIQARRKGPSGPPDTTLDDETASQPAQPALFDTEDDAWRHADEAASRIGYDRPTLITRRSQVPYLPAPPPEGDAAQR